jgi:hypothetical protein
MECEFSAYKEINQIVKVKVGEVREASMIEFTRLNKDFYNEIRLDIKKIISVPLPKKSAEKIGEKSLEKTGEISREISREI